MADTEHMDARELARTLLGLPGLEAMRLLIAGKLPAPSIAGTLGFTLIPLGMVHGGWALTLIDSCTGCAAHTTLPAGIGYTTVETKVNFVRAITPQTGQVRAEGKVIARGRTIITAEGVLKDAGGKLLAHGTSTLMVLRPEGKTS